jgi:hypothetical protein
VRWAPPDGGNLSACLDLQFVSLEPILVARQPRRGRGERGLLGLVFGKFIFMS